MHWFPGDGLGSDWRLFNGGECFEVGYAWENFCIVFSQLSLRVIRKDGAVGSGEDGSRQRLLANIQITSTGGL